MPQADQNPLEGLFNSAVSGITGAASSAVSWAWNKGTGLASDAADAVTDRVSEEITERTGLGQIIPSGDNPDGNDDGGWFDWLPNLSGDSDGWFNWKSGIGAAIGGALGWMLSGPLKFLATPIKWVSNLLPNWIGAPIRGVVNMATSGLGAAAAGATAGFALANTFFGASTPAPAPAPETSPATTTIVADKPADPTDPALIASGASPEFDSASSQEVARLQALATQFNGLEGPDLINAARNAGLSEEELAFLEENEPTQG